MPKAGKKRKKAEKSKTKLRQSIKLPKGLNETNAEVKSKTIKVLNQLRTQDGDEDRLSKKKNRRARLDVKIEQQWNGHQT